MSTHLSPRAAERRYYLITTTRWLPVGFVVGIFILVMTSRGLTIAQAATIGSTEAIPVPSNREIDGSRGLEWHATNSMSILHCD